MNWHVNSSNSKVAAWLAAGLVMVLPVAAVPVAQPAAPELVTRSTFANPTSPKDGRDPFYPNSLRPFDTVTAARPHTGDMSSLVLKGISGPPDHRLVIINSHTLGVGDEENIVTPQGPIHIRCVEIKERSVVIESGGQRHELKYTTTNP
jgi:hypothetical protein